MVPLKDNVNLTHFLLIKYCFKLIELLAVACMNSSTHVSYDWWLYPVNKEH